MYNLKVESFPSGTVRVNYYEYGIHKETRTEKPEMETEPFEGTCVRVVKSLVPDTEHSSYVSMARTRKMVYNYALSNGWDWFVTMTFSPKKVDRYNYTECSKKLKSFIDAARRICPDMRYIFVPELHKDGAFHFHGLLADCPALEFVFSGKVKNKRRVFNIPGFSYGFTTATKVSDSKKSANYLSKYITKDLCSVSPNKKRYWASRNLELPEVTEVFVSFGADTEEILDNIFDLSSYYKRILNPYNGSHSHFFEFPPGSGITIENFAPWTIALIA